MHEETWEWGRMETRRERNEGSPLGMRIVPTDSILPKPTPPMPTFPPAITSPTNKIKTLKRLEEVG